MCAVACCKFVQASSRRGASCYPYRCAGLRTSPMNRFLRDTIVVGASAGGIEALRELLAELPVEFPASIFIVQHQSVVSGRLVSILDRVTKLPVVLVEDEQPIQHGRVYLAPPDVHIVLSGDRVRAVRGPRENRARPSINVLFRPAAAARNGRVIGVLLTGLLDDGVADLNAVKRCGGVAIVQDPNDAQFSGLPRHALQALEVDHVGPGVDDHEGHGFGGVSGRRRQGDSSVVERGPRLKPSGGTRATRAQTGQSRRL